MSGAWKLSVENGLGNLLFDHADPEVNILTSENLRTLSQTLDEIAARTDIEVMIVTSSKSRIFIAGADIKEIDGIHTKEDAFQKAEEGKKVFQKLEDLKFPTVCVINGACLGGGYELALSCTYRVASFSEKVKIGLPECNLGILPGFGGSIRLPKLVGLMEGLPLILAGQVVSAEQALRKGMIDKLFPEVSLLPDALAFAAKLKGKGKKRPSSKKKDLTKSFLENTALGRMIVFNQAEKDVMKKTKGVYPAPLEIISLVKRTYGRSDAGAYRLESEHFARLGTTEVSKNLIRLFFLSEKYKKLRFTASTVKKDGVEKCGVVGAGIMGGGIAQLVSNRDIPVRVKDINEKALAGALKEAMSIYTAALRRRRMKPYQVEKKMNLISVGLDSKGLKNCDIIIEAVVEDLGIKQKVFKDLDSFTDASVILASNTSSLPVTQMALGLRFPERVVGLHFFNPVNRMPLVEIIRAEKTSDDVIERITLFARRLGKTAILVQDRPGFLVNRLLLPYMNEAAYLLQEGVTPERIDAIAEKFGMPMGPIELVDQVGIDVGYKVAHILHDAFGERMKVAAILEDVKKKGLLGKKSGKGFYIHEKDKKHVPNPEVKIGSGFKGTDEDILKRMIYIMVNEAARCLEEKVIDNAGTVDIGMIMGTGFPPHRGGLLRYADTIGAANILKDLEKYQSEVDAKRFEPSALLKELAKTNGKFHA